MRSNMHSERCLVYYPHTHPVGTPYLPTPLLVFEPSLFSHSLDCISNSFANFAMLRSCAFRSSLSAMKSSSS